MDILESIEESSKWVNKNSRYVKINYYKIDEMIPTINLSEVRHWLNSNPFNILELGTQEIINFLLILHTIGDYCFWGEPKWTIRTEEGYLDGTYAMMYIIAKRLKEGKSFDISFEEFGKLFEAEVKLPLLEDRYNNLVEMNKYLNSQGTDFYTLIKKFNLDKDLFDYIIKNFSYFEDKTSYEGNKVYFYKRAQLLTSDILHIMEKREGIAVDYHNLVGCADYKIPQVMMCLGILEYNDELSNIIDRKIELPENSLMEIEIRANDLVVIDYISKKLGGSVTRIDINDYIWSLGQDKTKINKPYHRTLTKHY